MAEEFERIVREFQDKVFRLAFSMLGDRAAAEETAQEVLFRVWKGLPRFRAESSLSTWIYSITRNACLTARSRGGKEARGGRVAHRSVSGCRRFAGPFAGQVPARGGALLHAGKVLR
jgi:RNA polymerase sigma factor (sigma-70 family)